MKAVVAAFNQEKALVGAFSVITNHRMQFGCNFLKHYYDHNQVTGRTKSEKNFNNKKGESNPRVLSIVFITILAELACIMPVSVADSLESHA